jgi:formate-dependent nitrite reductase membrane component NrfD
MLELTAQLNQPLPDSPWGPLLATYFVLVGIPSGLTLTAQWAGTRRGGGDRRVARRASSIALAVACVAGLLLVIDLGRPERFFLMLTQFDNVGSPISLGAKILALKIFLLVTELYLTRHLSNAGPVPAPGDRFTSVLGKSIRILLVLTSIALALYPVSVLSRTWVAPLAGTGGAALLYLTTALLMGTALYSVIELCTPPDDLADRLTGLRTAVLGLLGLYLVAGLFEWLALQAKPALYDQVVAFLTGTGGAVLFWGGAVGAGLILAAPGLLLRHAGRTVRVTSALLLVTGVAVVRYLIFGVGH